ncbi:acetate--CoA ligase family protein, partial [bacterium]|nr:acetate--CoA ligase family protein [bacterium]
MKLYEYQAKNIFKENKIPIPSGFVCSNENQVADAFASVGKGQEAVLKSQVLVGGRGKSGGIRIVKSLDEVVKTFRELMSMSIKGLPVSKVQIEEKIKIRNEYYVGITIDPTFSKPILLMSSRGGVDIETIAKESPSALYQYIVDPRYGIPSYRVHDAIGNLGIPEKLSMQFIDITKKLFNIFVSCDATLVEINPLVES